MRLMRLYEFASFAQRKQLEQQMLRQIDYLILTGERKKPLSLDAQDKRCFLSARYPTFASTAETPRMWLAGVIGCRVTHGSGSGYQSKKPTI